MIPMETVFELLNRLANDLRATVITLVSVAALIFVGFKVFKGGLAIAVCIGAVAAGAMVLWIIGGGMETLANLFGQTVQTR